MNDEVYWIWSSPDHVPYAAFNVIQTHNESSSPVYGGFYSGERSRKGEGFGKIHTHTVLDNNFYI